MAGSCLELGGGEVLGWLLGACLLAVWFRLCCCVVLCCHKKLRELEAWSLRVGRGSSEDNPGNGEMMFHNPSPASTLVQSCCQNITLYIEVRNRERDSERHRE